ncbi:hypothetical protein [Cupriavidus taiwanensis]|uniref:hypothetical protein n=1 Tax=Cupriavidus taiwanensis TaxID=164546 RepID=UPI000E2EF11E|nr:hypothetical protein [Cupriavidus taiwanensis]
MIRQTPLLLCDRCGIWLRLDRPAELHESPAHELLDAAFERGWIRVVGNHGTMIDLCAVCAGVPEDERP